MAKIKVRAQPGRLKELLRKKEMTMSDAKESTTVDRKTLRRIDQGLEVKRETVQKVERKLKVADGFLLDASPATPVTDDRAVPSTDGAGNLFGAPGSGNVLMRPIDVQRLTELLKGAARIGWMLNAQVLNEDTGKLLERFEEEVESLRRELGENGVDPGSPSNSLASQLRRMKKAQWVEEALEGLAAQRLCLLGAEYLFWESSTDEDSYTRQCWVTYTSSKTVLLYIEPLGTGPKRVWCSPGSVPPKFAPKNFRWPIFVNGMQLEADDEIPF